MYAIFPMCSQLGTLIRERERETNNNNYFIEELPKVWVALRVVFNHTHQLHEHIKMQAIRIRKYPLILGTSYNQTLDC